MGNALAASVCKHCSSLAIFFLCAFMLPLSGLTSPAGATEETRLNTVRVVSNPVIEGNVVSRYGTESTVVSQSQIEDMNAQDITSALRRTPGVTISRYNSVGSFGGAQGGGVFVRGSGSSRPGGELQIFYDGIPRINPVFSHPLLDIISIDPAASIRVYKSPQPQIFGNAHAAVDVQTKRKEEEGFVTKLGAQYGSYRGFMQRAEHGGKKGPYDYYIGQSFKHSDGHRNNSSGDLQSYFARLGVALNENWQVSWFGNVTDNMARDPGDRRLSGGRTGSQYANWDGRNNGRYTTRDAFGYLNLSHSYEKAAGSIKAYISHGEARWDGETSYNVFFPGGGRYEKVDTAFDWDTYGLRASERLFLWQGGEILFGLDVDAVSGIYHNSNKLTRTGQSFDRDTFTTSSPYIALSSRFGEKDGWYAIPSAGVRQYWHSVFEPQTAPHAGLIVGYKGTELHFGYARSVVYPGLNVAVFSQTLITPLVQNNPHGWRNLSAEVMDHYEAGVSWKFDSWLQADVTFFWDEGRNRYRMISNPGNATPAGFENIDKYWKSGFEGALTITPFATLSLFAGLSYLHSEPSYLPYAPKWTLSAGINWRFLERFQLSVDALYRDTMYTDSWSRAVPAQGGVERAKVSDTFLLNAKLAYCFELPSIHLEKGEIFIAAENITNTVYEYAPGYRMPGTTVTAGFSLSF